MHQGGVSFLFPPFRSEGLSSDCQTWQQTPSLIHLSEPSMSSSKQSGHPYFWYSSVVQGGRVDHDCPLFFNSLNCKLLMNQPSFPSGSTSHVARLSIQRAQLTEPVHHLSSCSLTVTIKFCCTDHIKLSAIHFLRMNISTLPFLGHYLNNSHSLVQRLCCIPC